MRHIQGHGRDHITLFPASLDEYITDDNPLPGCIRQGKSEGISGEPR